MSAAELAAVKAELVKLRRERKTMLKRVGRLELSHEMRRSQVRALKADLVRARGGQVSDLEVATVYLDELRDVLVTEALRSSSIPVATGLRLAAREVSRTRQRVAQRACVDEQVAA